MVVGDDLGRRGLVLLDPAAHRRQPDPASRFQRLLCVDRPHLLLKVALFGAMWGVGNVSYGLTMRHLGMSLGIGVAIGVTLVVGTLVPPIMHGQAGFSSQTRGGLITWRACSWRSSA